MKTVFIYFLIFNTALLAHVPALLLPIKGTPITSFFIGQSSISRAIYSELTEENDIFVVTMSISQGEKTIINLFTPFCKNLPRYEKFQPSALVIRGDLPWKLQGETNKKYIARLTDLAEVAISSNYSVGLRPTFYEPFAKMSYWVGGEWKGNLEPGFYSIVVFDSHGDKGNFNISLNEKEAWTPDLFSYVDKVLPGIKKGFCRPEGYTGKMVIK